MTRRQQAWALIIASVAIIVALLGVRSLIKPPPVCNPDVKARTVILIDHSEKVATQTADAIVERAWQFVQNEVQVGERVSVFNLSSHSRNDFKPIFSACKPREEASALTASVRSVQRSFMEKFARPLREALAADIRGSAESPVAQALIDLSLDELRFVSPEVTRLLVFSDLLEHTPEFSLYSCSDPGQAVRQFRNSRLGLLERPTFRHADIRLHVIPRRGVSRTALQCRERFWLWFFGDNQGSCKSTACLTTEYLPGN